MTALMAAGYVIDEAREGIAWIAFGKDGKGWDVSIFWGNVEDGAFLFEDDEDRARAKEIIAKDENAILVNTYYYNFGEYETITQKDLADSLRWHYERHTNLLRYVI